MLYHVNEHRDLAATETFIEALENGNLRMRIRDKEPRSLDHALQIALLAEANSEFRRDDDASVKNKEYKLRAAKAVIKSAVSSVMAEKVQSTDTDKVERLNVFI